MCLLASFNLTEVRKRLSEMMAKQGKKPVSDKLVVVKRKQSTDAEEAVPLKKSTATPALKRKPPSSQEPDSQMEMNVTPKRSRAVPQIEGTPSITAKPKAPDVKKNGLLHLGKIAPHGELQMLLLPQQLLIFILQMTKRTPKHQKRKEYWRAGTSSNKWRSTTLLVSMRYLVFR